jgi:hypothetical protein
MGSKKVYQAVREIEVKSANKTEKRTTGEFLSSPICAEACWAILGNSFTFFFLINLYMK